MPWLNAWPEYFKKRACRYLLQRYMGQYLKEKLTLDQLSVDLYKGTGEITDLNLDVDALNEMAVLNDLPVEFVDGFIKRINVSIPWSSLLQKSSFVEVAGLMITIQPRERSGNSTIMNSIWSSMTTSMELAQECLRQQEQEQEQEDRKPDTTRTLDGMEGFAQTIDSVLSRTQIRFLDTVLRLEHVPKGSKIGVSLEIRIKKVDYFDADGIQSNHANDQEQPRNVHEHAAFTSKTFHMEGFMLYTDEFPSNTRTISKSLWSPGLSPEARVSEPYSTAPDTPEMGLQEPVFSTSVTNSIQEPPSSSNFAIERNSILIAKINGKNEIRVRLKQCVTKAGPNVSLDFSIGGIVLYSSPRQVHILSELTSGLVSPDVEDHSNVVHHYAVVNKPMQASDFERVEQELQKQLSPQIHGHSLQHQQGWSSQSLEDSDEEFLPVIGPGHGMTTSTISNASTQMSDAESTSTSGSGFKKSSLPLGSLHPSHHAAGHHGRPRRQSSQGAIPMMLDDPLAEATHFKLQLTSVVIIILHEDILTLAPTGSGFVAECSVKQMQSKADNFFNDLGVFTLGAHTDQDLVAGHKKLSAACKVNHLRFIGAPCTIEGNDKASSTLKSFSFTLGFGTAELMECLFDKRLPPGQPDPEPEYCTLWGPHVDDAKGKNSWNSPQFFDATSNHPCFKLKISHLERIHSQNSSRLRNVAPPRTELELHLAPCETELDVTIVDRITCLLNPLDLCGHVTQASPAQANNQGFIFQAMEEGNAQPGNKLELSISSPFLVLKIRFPIPDLRPFHDMDRAPWWKRMIRDDALILEMTQARFHTVFDKAETLWSLDAQCKELHGLFQENPSDPPISFICASPGNESSANSKLDEDDNGLDWPRFCLKVCPPSPNLILEEQEPDDSDDAHNTSIDTLVHNLCASDSAEPSPFSTRKVIFESQHSTKHDLNSEEKKNPGDSSPEGEKMVLPGERHEVAEFIEHSINNSRIAIELNLANANVVFPNKHFYEVLYNRISTDLLLWEPAAPRSVTKDSTNIRQTPANVDWASNIMQETVYQTFSSCKSTLLYESSSDSEEENPSYFSFYEQKQKQKKHPTVNAGNCLQNKICFTISIKQAAISLHTPLRDALGKVETDHEGEVLLQLKDATFFAVSKPVGSPTAGYMCLHANHARVFHKGILPCSMEPKRVMPTDLSRPKHLDSVLYCSEIGTWTKMSGYVGSGEDTLDMLLLSVKISLDPSRNVKTFCVALGLCGATHRYYRSPIPESWFSQFLDFFDVVDFPISGYKPPDVITELHIHTRSCAIDYRPLYLPLRVILTIESLSVCSNIAAQKSSSVYRAIIEDAYLFLSKRIHATNVDLKKDYVCVADLSFFEASYRTSDGQDQPKLDMRLSSNMLHARTCVDSFRALLDLIFYCVRNGDKRDLNCNQDQNLSEDSAPASLQSDVSPLSIAAEERFSNLMAEAMAELSCSSQTNVSEKGHTTPPQIQHPDVDMFLFPHETQQLRKQSSSFYPSCGDTPSFVEPTCIDSDSDDSDDGFCILENDPGVGILARSGEPQIKMLTTDPIRPVENFFTIPLGRMDQLKAPEYFPKPVKRYTIKEISLIWHFYGGSDFPPDEPMVKPRSRKKSDACRKQSDFDSDYFCVDSPSTDNCPQNFFADMKNSGVAFSKANPAKVHWKPTPTPGKPRSSWQVQGGPGRQHDVLMELQLNKVRCQHEEYPDSTLEAARQVLLIHEAEIRDRLASSQINKFFYQYSSENMPRQSNANQLVVKALHVRPDLSRPTLECDLKATLLPVRLNVDQDALFFMINYIESVLALPKDDAGFVENAGPGSEFAHYSSSPKSGYDSLDSLKYYSAKSSNSHPAPIRTVAGAPSAAAEFSSSKLLKSDSQNLLITFEDTVRNTASSSQAASSETCESPTAASPIFFRSITISKVPIRLDYHGKRVDMEQGALAGILIGLGQLNCSELYLKKIVFRHGLLGWQRVGSFLQQEWGQDIRQNQLPSLLGGVGPLHSLVQLFQGVRDLICLPIEQYRKDGRVVRGLQRGANAFTTSTAMAALELTNRMVQAVQCTAETAYDVVSPGPSVRTKGIGGHHQRRKRPSQPADIREGMANAYHVVRDGLGDTARTLVQVASSEHEHKGISGAVGGVLRQIPSTVVTPIILATEATSNVLGGMRHQLAPDVRREAAEKWRVEN